MHWQKMPTLEKDCVASPNLFKIHPGGIAPPLHLQTKLTFYWLGACFYKTLYVNALVRAGGKVCKFAMITPRLISNYSL